MALVNNLKEHNYVKRTYIYINTMDMEQSPIYVEDSIQQLPLANDTTNVELLTIIIIIIHRIRLLQK